MTLATKKRRYWTCRKCSYRNEHRTSSRRCQGCGEQTKPKPRVPGHARVLQGDTYPLFVKAAREIHGVTDESCCVCGKPRSQDRRNDRDHFHRGPYKGLPRGLACPGNTGCNVLMLPWITAATAGGIAHAKFKAKEPDAELWALIACYLDRAERFYAAKGF